MEAMTDRFLESTLTGNMNLRTGLLFLEIWAFEKVYFNCRRVTPHFQLSRMEQ
jgi:hypothetical protein